MFKRTKAKTVFVGLSGGVDSSVAASRLLDQGYSVVGVFIKVWQPDFLKCDWEQERLDAMRVAAHLKIPFLTCDAEAEYKHEVGEYFINEYIAGRTPNPDVMCNRYVKFGAFWRFAKEYGADYIATGHYAQVKKTNDCFELIRGRDTDKDQTYFLWTLTQEDLSHVLFPVGDSTKADIREEAKKLKLPTAVKKDSQGICFLGHVDIKEFIGHFTKLQSGKVLNVHGDEIGKHEDSHIYTLGQRHGFTIFGEEAQVPHYVVAKDVVANVVVVDINLPVLHKENEIKLSRVSLVDAGCPLPTELDVQFRYRQIPIKAKVLDYTEGNITLTLLEESEKPASGQSAVIYCANKCLGGGVIE